MSRPRIIFSGSKNEQGENIVHYLCRAGYVNDLMFLRDVNDDDRRHCLMEYNNKQQQCVHIVASEDKDAVEKMKLLVLWGADVNSKTLSDGDTPLHIAVKARNYQLAEWLCKQPSLNREALNNDCMTPYHVAFTHRDEKMMEVLKKNGAKCMVPLQSEANSADEDYEP